MPRLAVVRSAPVALRKRHSEGPTPLAAPPAFAELERRAARLGQLDPAARELVEQVTRAVVNKLLHEPTVRVKEAAGTAEGETLADALADLFALDE